MASVKRRGAVWRIRYRFPGEKNPRSFSMPKGTARRDAERFARKVQLEIDTTGYWSPAAAAPLTLREAVDAYIADRGRGTPEKPAAKPRTIKLYRTVLGNLFLSRLQGAARTSPSVRVLSRDLVSEFLVGCRNDGCSEGTVKTYATTVSAFWRWLHGKYPEVVPSVSMPRVHLPPPKQVLAPTWAEADSMLEQLTDRARSVRRTATIARFTGLRCSQAAATTWADFSVDWEGRGPALHVRVTKTEQEAALNRWVPLAPALAHRLLQWKMLDGRPGDDALIIGAPLPRDPGDTVGAAWSRAGVPEDRWRKRPFHSLRKRFVSHMVEAGVSDAAINYLVGHVPKGVRARHYVDPRALWPAMKQAVATIPDIGEGPEATPSFPHASLQVP